MMRVLDARGPAESLVGSSKHAAAGSAFAARFHLARLWLGDRTVAKDHHAGWATMLNFHIRNESIRTRRQQLTVLSGHRPLWALSTVDATAECGLSGYAAPLSASLGFGACAVTMQAIRVQASYRHVGATTKPLSWPISCRRVHRRPRRLL